MVKDNLPPGLLHGLGVGLICNVRGDGENFPETGVSAVAVLELLSKVHQLFHRLGKVADVEQEGYQVSHLQLPVGHQEGSHHQGPHGDHGGEGVHSRVVAGHIQVILPLGRQKTVISLLKFLHLPLLISKGLHHPDSGEAVLHLAVHIGDPSPGGPEGGFHPAVKNDGINQHHRHNGHIHQGQLQVHRGQDGEGSQQLDSGDHQILRAVVQKLGDVKEIRRHPGEQMPHLLVIVKGKGQLLVMAEDFIPHIPLNPGAHHMSKVGYVVVADRLDGHHPQHYRRQLKDQAHRLPLGQVDHRVGDVAHQ